MNLRHVALYACFFVSGASALVYEIVWQRMLTLVFGLSTFSVAAVLSAFLAGLALGARVFGPTADRSGNPLRLYALIEVSIAAAGLASSYFADPVMGAFAWAYAGLEPGWWGSNLIRFGLSLAVIGVPSTLIGATVPMMSRLMADRAFSTSVGFGRFYAVNTLGSVVGAGLAGFVLLRQLGQQGTVFVAVAGNLSVGLVAALMSLGRGVRGAAAREEAVSGAGDDSLDGFTPAVRGRFALAVAAVTGAGALAYEVAWIRLLAVFTLNSVYVFTMVVSLYLAGLSIGAAIATRILHLRRWDAPGVLVTCQVVQALLVPIVLAAIPAATRLGLTRGDISERSIFILEYALAAAVVVVPTILIGMTLPLIVGIAPSHVGQSGRHVGRVYAYNAVGTIAGAALTGAFCIPFFGLRGTLLLAAALNFIVAACAAGLQGARSPAARVTPLASAATFALLLAVLPTTSRFYVPADAPNERIIAYQEGPSATVHVAEYTINDKSHRTLFVDSKSVAGTYDEIVTDQKMLAHVPLLLHPSPERALTVGFGTGGTSYSMLLHSVTVHCVEIEPAVAAQYKLFESENRLLVGPNHDRGNFRLVIDDARAWLTVAPQPYDVIVTDLTSIQYRGNGNLYTKDCFELLRSRLAPGGIGCAWVPITGITPEALKVLIRTFREVFEHTSVWYIVNLPTDFVILVGTPEVLTLRLDQMADGMQPKLVKEDLESIGMDNVHKIAACLLLAEEQVADYVGAGPIHTDDRPILDYMTHASPYHNTLGENLSEMLAYRSDPRQFIAGSPRISDGQHEALDRWVKASAHLIDGHILLNGADPDRRWKARKAYEAAAALVPEDRLTRQLIEELRR